MSSFKLSCFQSFKIRISICLVVLAGVNWTLEAQTHFLNQHAWKETWTDLKIQVIYQDQQAVIWVGTDQGLFRYDGFDYHFYDLPGSSGSQSVTSIFESKSGKVWIGYAEGDIGELSNNQLLKWPRKGWPNVPIKGFTEDHAGNLWIATYGAGMWLAMQDKMIAFSTLDGLPSNEIYATITDQRGNIWAATDDGIWFCKFQNNKKSVVKAPAQSGIPSDIIQSLLNDESGNIWIGRYDQSPLKYNLKTLTAKPIMSTWPYGVVKVIEPAASGELWVATESNGLISFTIENGTWKANTFDPSQRKTRISALHCDQEFNLWIGSPDQGLQSTNLLFSFLEASVPNAQAIYSLPDGNFLVGTAKGLFLQSITDENISQIRKIETPLPLNIVSIAQDQYGNIWLGTFGNYVFVYQPSSNKFRQIGTREGLNNESILSMYTKGNSVWMATLGGVFQIDLNEDPMLQKRIEIKNLHAEKAIGTSFIYQVTGDQLGNIWFATDGKGIASMRNGKIEQYPKALNSNTRTVYSIAVDSKGSVWIGTGRNGLYEFNNNRLIPHGIEQGLRNTEISMLIKDKIDRILIVHPEGIDRYDPASKQFSYYDQESGLKGIQPNINSYTIDINNNIWIGTQQGLLKYQALQGLSYRPTRPGLALLNVLNMQEPVLGKTSNEFNRQQNFLTFQFQGSWYSNPSLIRYRYRLIGQDLQWRYTRDMEVNYSNLSPGKYEFEIQVSISNQFINAPKETYAFVINPPFYANPWFALLLITSFGGVVYYLIKQRERTLRQRAKLQKERIEFQFNSLKNQINPHFLFNSLNTLTALIEENSSAAVSYVENLSDFYRSILQFGETDLITLKEELELVRNFIFLVDQRFTGNLHIDIDIEDEGGLVPPLALQMLVENAIKHNIISKARPLSVRIYDREDKLWVTNTLQRKAKPEKSSGIGLQNILCRYRLLGKGQVVVEENEQQFIVGIPRIVDFPKI